MPLSSRSIVRLQAASGLSLAIFVGLHLMNLFAAMWGPEVYDGLQTRLRWWYQSPVYEIFGLGVALMLHLGCAWLRIRQRKARGSASPAVPWPLRAHRWSGYFLASVIFVHAAATRGPSLLWGIWPGFAGVSFTFWWLPWFFYPYYAALALAGFIHLAYGTSSALSYLTKNRKWAISPGVLRACSIGVGLAIIGALLALGGVTVEIEDPSDNDYARLYTSPETQPETQPSGEVRPPQGPQSQ